MKLSRVLCAALFCMFFLVSFAQAETYIWSSAQVQFDIPEGWSQTLDGVPNATEGDTLVVSSPGDHIAMVFFVIDADDVEKAILKVQKDLEESLNDLEFSEDVSETEINGMPMVTLSGTAEKGKLEVSIDLVITPNAQVLTAVTIANPKEFKKWVNDLMKIVKSLQPYTEEEQEEEER